jgi:hypothetical protein
MEQAGKHKVLVKYTILRKGLPHVAVDLVSASDFRRVKPYRK